MVITKRSFRFDPATRSFVSGAPGGGRIIFSGGQFVRQDAAGQTVLSQREVKGLLAGGQRAEAARQRPVPGTRQVKAGEIKSIDEILDKGLQIREAEVVGCRHHPPCEL